MDTLIALIQYSIIFLNVVKMNPRTTNTIFFLIDTVLIVSSNLEHLRVYITEITVGLVFHTLYNRGNTILRFTRAECLDSGCSGLIFK